MWPGVTTSAFTIAVGWTLLHFVWQGCLIAGGLGAVLLLMRRRSADARYLACCAALLLMLAAPLLTVAWLTSTPAPAWMTGHGVGGAHRLVERYNSGSLALLTDALPYLVGLWLAGVTLLSLRLAGGFLQNQRIKRKALRTPDDRWQEVVDRLCGRLKLRTVVRVAESAATSVPTLIGCLRPVILMPVCAATGLTRAQLEIVFAHELAHIRRHDYVVNLLQAALEALLFYHPGVWWLSARTRDEREYCCDDLVVTVCGDPVSVARTLADLETLRGGALRLAPSIAGGSLMSRINRLIGGRWPTRRRASSLIAALASIAGAVGLTAMLSYPAQAPAAAAAQVASEAEALQTIVLEDVPETDGARLEGPAVQDATLVELLALLIPQAPADEAAQDGLPEQAVLLEWLAKGETDAADVPGLLSGAWAPMCVPDAQPTASTACEVLIELRPEQELVQGGILLKLVPRFTPAITANLEWRLTGGGEQIPCVIECPEGGFWSMSSVIVSPTSCTLSLSADVELHEEGAVTIRVDEGELEQALLVEELEATQPR